MNRTVLLAIVGVGGLLVGLGVGFAGGFAVGWFSHTGTEVVSAAPTYATGVTVAPTVPAVPASPPVSPAPSRPGKPAVADVKPRTTKKQFTDEELSKAVLGLSRAEVRKTLGAPDSISENGNYWTYMEIMVGGGGAQIWFQRDTADLITH